MQKHGNLMHLWKYKTMLRLFVRWQVGLLLCLKSEEQILSCGVDVIYRCPPASFLHLLTLVPDVWACHSALGYRESGVLVKVLQAVREFGIWNNFFVEDTEERFMTLYFFYKLSLPCEFDLLSPSLLLSYDEHDANSVCVELFLLNAVLCSAAVLCSFGPATASYT